MKLPNRNVCFNMVYHGDLQYKKKRTPRCEKVSCLIQCLVADFICEYLSIPVTVSRVDVTKDLSMAKIFFMTPHPMLVDKVGFRDILLKMFSNNIVSDMQKIKDNDILFLKYLNYMHFKISKYVAKSSRLRKTPSLFFFIENKDFYNKGY